MQLVVKNVSTETYSVSWETCYCMFKVISVCFPTELYVFISGKRVAYPKTNSLTNNTFAFQGRSSSKFSLARCYDLIQLKQKFVDKYIEENLRMKRRY